MQFKRLITTIDMHAAGEPLRVITSGIPTVRGKTMLERRADFAENLDWVRRLLMYEPRGHHGMYGCVITPPEREQSDFGMLLMHNEGYSTMCGHCVIAAATMAVETGLVEWTPGRERIVIDTPAGEVTAWPEVEGGSVKSVSFDNVPSFVYLEHVPVEADGTTVNVDIAYGGAFYAIVEAADLGVRVDIAELDRLTRLGKHIKHEIERKMDVRHPLLPDIRGIYGVIFSDEPRRADSHLRNVTVFADGQIDRSPCGTGTCARMALLHLRGRLAAGEAFVHESIIGSQFTGVITGETEVGPYRAVLPRIKGRAFMTGIHQFVADPSDPLIDGFLLR